MDSRKIHKGSAFLLSTIILAVLSAWAVSIFTMTSLNVRLADNQRKANQARACAESGLEITRYWLSRVSLSGTTAPELRFNQIKSSLQNDLTASGITNVNPTYDTSQISIPDVTLNSAQGQTFSATIIPLLDLDTVQVDVTGTCGAVAKTIRVHYEFGTRANTVFDFGVASKGPLSLAGNILLTGYKIALDSDVYIESENANLALSIIGNSQIAGDVSIVNPNANVLLQGGQAGIGGETGDDAIENHVSFGVPPTEFPVPNPNYFGQLVALTPLDPATYTTQTTFENITIPPNTNPVFAAGVTLRGLVFVEAPNVVDFSGHANINGIIVGDGDMNDDSATNKIIFRGTVDSTSVPDEAQFDPLRDKTGTFLMAPGFSVSFGGDFHTLNGAMAANGVEFFGDAGGTINGSIVNYSDEEMILSGNSDLCFNRSGTNEMPAGFIPDLVLQYDPTSYSEIVL